MITKGNDIMAYMVMECHPAYAVVLDSAGKFLKVANMNYSVGQTVTSVIEMGELFTDSKEKSKVVKFMKPLVAIAACFAIFIVSSPSEYLMIIIIT